MKNKTSSLEVYYSELNNTKPFDKLSTIEKDQLELSEGFRTFLIRDLWTNIFFAVVLIVVFGSVLISLCFKL